MTENFTVTMTTNPDPVLVCASFGLSALVFCLNAFLIIHGIIRKRRGGSAQGIPTGLAIASTCLLFTALTTALLRLAYAFHMAATQPQGAAVDAMLRMAISHQLQVFAASLPAVGLGFIGVLGLKSARPEKE